MGVGNWRGLCGARGACGVGGDCGMGDLHDLAHQQPHSACIILGYVGSSPWHVTRGPATPNHSEVGQL